MPWTGHRWSGNRGSNPGPRPWHGRALPLSYIRLNLQGRAARDVSSGPRGNLLKSRPTHRCMPGRPSVTGGARREGSCEKQKGPDPCWNPGLDVCSSGRVCALTRLPRPVVTANPHNQGKPGLAASGWTTAPDSSQWLACQGDPCQRRHSWRARPHDCPSGAVRGGGCGQRCSR